MTGRSATAQLKTARLLLAQFDAQLAEYDAMNRTDRRGTPRGQDLSARLAGLREGRARRATRVRELEPLAADEQRQDSEEVDEVLPGDVLPADGRDATGRLEVEEVGAGAGEAGSVGRVVPESNLGDVRVDVAQADRLPGSGGVAGLGLVGGRKGDGGGNVAHAAESRGSTGPGEGVTP